MRGLAEIIRLRTGECRDASDAITQIAAGEPDVEVRSAEHVAECLRCQAEVAAYRRILRTMSLMRDDLADLPAGGLTAVLAAVEAAAVDHAAPTWAVKVAYIGGITVATAAAGTAGVLVWMSRRRLAAAS